MQAAQRLAHQYQVETDLPSYQSFFGLNPTDFGNQLKICSDFVQHLIDTTPATYRDHFTASDIGQERLLVIQQLNLKQNSLALDMGCGRGYTTFAAALQGTQVIGLDLMNGGGRQDWWHNWTATAKQLHLSPFGIRGDILAPPIQSNTGLTCLSIHAIRNLPSPTVFTGAFRQMARIAGPQGCLAIAESLPYATTKAQTAHLQLYNLRSKYHQGDLALLPKDELTTLVETAGCTITDSTIHDFRLAATPPLYWLDPQSIPKPDRQQAIEEYTEAIAAIHKHGETSPPTLLLTAIPQEK
jgi:SAM-dependent methyltransferase